MIDLKKYLCSQKRIRNNQSGLRLIFVDRHHSNFIILKKNNSLNLLGFLMQLLQLLMQIKYFLELLLDFFV